MASAEGLRPEISHSAAESLFVFARQAGLTRRNKASVLMARSSQESDLDRLVAEHLPAALRFATRLTGEPGSAEDVVQDALLRVIRGWKSFRAEAEFRTWLFRIVINVFRDRLRTQPHFAALLGPETADTRAANPAHEAEHIEFGELVARRVSALPPRQREVMILTAFEGFSAKEVADLLRITPGNVHATLGVARERLRNELAPYLAER
jgi:RNA polymerase sigma-70 factor, ECF subfamily